MAPWTPEGAAPWTPGVNALSAMGRMSVAAARRLLRASGGAGPDWEAAARGLGVLLVASEDRDLRSAVLVQTGSVPAFAVAYPAWLSGSEFDRQVGGRLAVLAALWPLWLGEGELIDLGMTITELAERVGAEALRLVREGDPHGVKEKAAKGRRVASKAA